MLPYEREYRRERQRRAASLAGCVCISSVFLLYAVASQTLRRIRADDESTSSTLRPTADMKFSDPTVDRGAVDDKTTGSAIMQRNESSSNGDDKFGITSSATGSPLATETKTSSLTQSITPSVTPSGSQTASASLSNLASISVTPSLTSSASVSGSQSISASPSPASTPTLSASSTPPDGSLNGTCTWLPSEQAALRQSTWVQACGGRTFYDGVEHGVGGARCPPGYESNGSVTVEEDYCSDWPSALSQHGGRPDWDAPFRVRGCKFDWYSPRQVCAILEQAGQIIMIGDSLSRHLAQSLMILAAGDYVRGGMLDVAQPECVCDAQYDDARKCRDASSAYRAEHDLPPGEVCPNWRGQHIAFLSEWEGYDPVRVQRYLDKPEFRGNRTLVYISLGMHLFSIKTSAPLNSAGIIDRYYKDVLQRLSARMAAFHGSNESSKFDRLIVGTTTPPGPNKPSQYEATQGMAVMSAHAQAMRRYQAQTPGSLLFDSFVVMENTSSYDGTHFLQQQNIVAAQAFLNVLVKGLGDIRVPAVFPER